ncbi:OmpA family protein [Methylomicrobium sp. Wu6]|uniref:OmpA family protein n=1 Tax=Methylomicrobium sp. Wu6 TaxID=3107928 RepID=UPI002DD6AFEC|nr:OmpA family protein [Methylomicrobium sp. Wu6]MEC4747577.1 OmpA family protein [Methylomicrobium sp. Wu6]
MRNFNKIPFVIATTIVLTACSTTPDCPFGMSGDRCEEITVKIYLPPVVSDLSYQKVGGLRDQAIIQGGFQHTLSLPGQEITHVESGSALTSSMQTFPLPPALETPLPEIQSVLFEFDQADLSVSETQKLDSFLLKIPPSNLLHVSIEGHTDSKGSSGYNKKLSTRRARSVRDYLIQHGVDPSKISAKGFGESSPVESNQTDEGRLKNRRAELIPITER